MSTAICIRCGYTNDDLDVFDKHECTPTPRVTLFDVDCPICGAAPGERCRTEDDVIYNRKVDGHARRHLRAFERNMNHDRHR